MRAYHGFIDSTYLFHELKELIFIALKRVEVRNFHFLHKLSLARILTEKLNKLWQLS